MHDTPLRAWVEVDLGALLRNGEALVAHAGVPLLPMVKADAYGLGAGPVARMLERLHPWGFGVATVDEGNALRRAGVERPIIVFTPPLPAELTPLRHARLTPALGRPDVIAEWSAAGAGAGAWHLSIDTGMSRDGVRWDDVAALKALASVRPAEGAFTHFLTPEHPGAVAGEQERRFKEALAALPWRPRVMHAENSPAVVRRGRSPWTLVRPGIFLYGGGIAPGSRAPEALVPEGLVPEPVAHVRARIVDLRMIHEGDTVSYDGTYRAPGPRRIATIAMGYGDGYRRSLSNCGVGLVRGRRIPVVGTVTMDMTMFDVTDVPCDVGDVVTVLGRDGDHLLTLDAVASTAGVSPYELLSGLRVRLPRRYRGILDAVGVSGPRG